MARGPALARRTFLALVAALPLAPFALPPVARAGEDGPPAIARDPDDAALEAALSRARSPFLLERQEGVAALTRMGRVARPAVLAAFAHAPDGRLLPFADVLAADGGPEAIDALVDRLPRTKDPADAAAIRWALVHNAELVADGLRAYRAARGDRVPPELEGVERLLVRVQVETEILARKSRSGGTGYYREQFATLRRFGDDAVDVCFAILSNREVDPPRALRVPGEVPPRAYRWLRRPTFLLSRDEARTMAANALGDLVRPDDRVTFARLHGLVLRWAPRNRWDDRDPDLAQYDAVLAIQYRHRGTMPAGSGDPRIPSVEGDGADLPEDPVQWYEERADERVQSLTSNRGDVRGLTDAAELLLRMRRFREAIRLYDQVIEAAAVGALPYYNKACALALWSLEAGLTDRERGAYRRMALLALAASGESGYEDWPWMEQDRDLDALRDDPKYAVILAKMKERFRAPPALLPKGR